MRVEHVGFYLKQELDKRNWTQTEFAEIINKPVKTINQIINSKAGVSPKLAHLFGEAFNQDPMYWMQLHNKYLLDQVKRKVTYES